MAAVIDRLPLSGVLGTDVKALIAQNPSYGLAKSLLTARWATSAILSLLANITSADIGMLTWIFGYLCLSLSAAPCFLIARTIGLGSWQAMLITVAILVGFWSQVVLDMQALSHLHALPIALLWAFLVIETQGQPWKTWMVNGKFLLVLATCALSLAYPEILPFLLLGWVLHFIWMMVCWHVSFKRVALDSLPVVVGLALTLLISPSLINFLKGQLLYGAIAKNDWDLSYFTWLYSNPLAALWGLTHIDLGYFGLNPTTNFIWKLLTGIFGLILTSAALIFLVINFFKRGAHSNCNVVATMIIAGGVQTLVLLTHQQWWAAGKAVSYFYPFLWLAAGWMLFIGIERYKKNGLITRLFYVLGIIWVFSQLSLGIARIGIAATNSNYKGYMSHHGFYRQHDWNLHPITQALEKKPNEPIALITENTWLGEYVCLSIGNRWPIHFATDVIDRAGNPLFQKSNLSKCRYLLIDRRMSLETKEIRNHRFSGRNKDIVLIDIERDEYSAPVLVAAANPNGFERAPDDTPFLWLGGQATTIWVATSKDKTALLSGKWHPGPSLPEREERTLKVMNDENGSTEVLKITSKTLGLVLRLHRGLNRFTLHVCEQPSRTILPSGDTRPLLLGLQNPHFQD